MNAIAAAELGVLLRKHQSKQWQNEALFWLHAAIIVAGLFMGLVFPFWAVVVIVVLHRLHLKIFNGCIISKWQTANNGLSAEESYISQLWRRLFNKKLTVKGVRVVDYSIMVSTLLIGLIACTDVGTTIAIGLGTVLFAAWGVQACWRLRREPKTAATCGIGSCNEVRTSQFSRFMGVPIEVFGLGYFSTVAISTALLPTDFLLMPILVSLGVLTSMVFIVLQKQVLRQLCQLCMNVHAASMCLTGMVLFRSLFAA